ncbi:MAG: LamG domain-containing protein [Acidobacteriaceae bacterium]
MTWRVPLCKVLAIFLLCSLGESFLVGQAKSEFLVAKCLFQKGSGSVPADSASGRKEGIEGYYAYVPGVTGTGVRFDGYTTSAVCPIEGKWGPGASFTVEAWVALNTYPWNWVPVVDQEREQEEGFSFGIDAFGDIGLGASINGRWRELVSTAKLPLKKWQHISGTFASSEGQVKMALYINGKKAGELALQGEFTPVQTDMLIGRVRQAVLPFPEAAIHPYYPIKYSLDGILNDVEMYDRSLNEAEIASDFAAFKAPKGDVLPWQKLPSGPPGAGRFGAYYTTLHYQDSWDRLSRVGPDSDVLVRFDESPVRLVFWKGTNYIPAWVTENDKWYNDKYIETFGPGCGVGGDCEPMSDKQVRYSHVKILESDNARVVIEWRYADPEVEEYDGANPDPLTGAFDWVNEFWTVYPDGVAVRKQVLYSSNLSAAREWQDTLVINQPGTRPEDNINWDAITLENMKGETKTYTWKPKPEGSFIWPNAPLGPGEPEVTEPQGFNIQWVNLKSNWKPFQILPPDGVHADISDGEYSYFNFECWNHWPVAQIPSSGRPCVADDRASHTALTHLWWKAYAKSGDTETKLLVDGLTTKSPSELLPLAKSWLSPAKVEVTGDGYSNEGYDPTQRAYVFKSLDGEGASALKLTFEATHSSPIYDPALVITNWGEHGARLAIDGKPVAWGRSYRMGVVHRLSGTDLVVWMQMQATDPLQMELLPTNR